MPIEDDCRYVRWRNFSELLDEWYTLRAKNLARTPDEDRLFRAVCEEMDSRNPYDSE